MDKENKVIELNDEELERVTGGYGDGPCPYGYSKPSLSTCNSGCPYCTTAVGDPGYGTIPWCDYLMKVVR